MPVPILRQGRLLVASMPPEATDRDLHEFMASLAERVGESKADGVVIDVSALEVLDSFATRVLETVGQVAQLRGAATVVVGIQPHVAFAMVELGVTLEGVRTALDLGEGIDLLREEMADGHHGS